MGNILMLASETHLTLSTLEHNLSYLSSLILQSSLVFLFVCFSELLDSWLFLELLPQNMFRFFL